MSESITALKQLLRQVPLSAGHSHSAHNEHWQVFMSPLPGNREDTYHAFFMVTAITSGQTNPDGLTVSISTESPPGDRIVATMDRAGKLVLKDLPVGRELSLEIPEEETEDLVGAVHPLGLAASDQAGGSQQIPVKGSPGGADVHAEVVDSRQLGQFLLVRSQSLAGKTLDLTLDDQPLKVSLNAQGIGSVAIPDRVNAAACVATIVGTT
jgi:hypothetical protein